jgi:SAM-dependent methyltransferase
MSPFNLIEHNSRAWDDAVRRRSEWTIPVEPQVTASARRGEWQIVLTPQKPVPRVWFPPLDGSRILCLASGGGQQGPILAAVVAASGGSVVVFDNSLAQLAQDEMVADRDSLPLSTVKGDMRDLSMFEANSFDLIVHPVSNLFVPDVRPVWQEAARVLRPGGVMLAGFTNPVLYLFDQQSADEGVFHLRHRLPYSDLTSIDEKERAGYIRAKEALEFGHTLEQQLGGQLEAGFVLTALYEDGWDGVPLAEYTAIFMATRAVLPG